MEEERKKENSTELQQPNIEAEVYNNNKMCDWIYTYTYTIMSKVKTTQQKYSILMWQTKEIKKLYLPVKNKTN